MLDELDRLFPEPPWLMASSEFADHTQDGIELMRGRSLGGRRKVHTELCALARPAECSCSFRDPASTQDAADTAVSADTTDAGDAVDGHDAPG